MPASDPQVLAGENTSVASNAARGALAIAAIVLVAITLRPGIVSVGPVLPSIIDEFGLSHAAASLLTSIPDVLMGLLALPTPWLARRFGRDPILLAAILLLSVSIAARAFAIGPFTLLASTAGVGTGIAIAGAMMAGFIKGRFPSKAALLMGIYATALSFGSTVSAAVTGPIAVNVPGGWRFASGIWSILGIVAISIWLAIAFSERRDRGLLPAPVTPAGLPLKDKTAWLVALYFACINFLFYALLSWTSTMYVELGFATSTAGFVLASFTAVFMLANPIFGYVSKSHDRRGWLAVCSGLSVAGLIGVATVPMLPFLFIPLTAVGLGGAFTLGMTLPLDNTRSVEEANVWNAFVLTVGYLLASTGPLLVGRLRDISGDFQPGMWLCVSVAAGMLIITPFLHPKISVG